MIKLIYTLELIRYAINCESNRFSPYCYPVVNEVNLGPPGEGRLGDDSVQRVDQNEVEGGWGRWVQANLQNIRKSFGRGDIILRNEVTNKKIDEEEEEKEEEEEEEEEEEVGGGAGGGKEKKRRGKRKRRTRKTKGA